MSAIDNELWERVRTSELPLILTRLSDFTIHAATEAALVEFGMRSEEVLGGSVFDVIDIDERPHARQALEALADGTIDFFRTFRPQSHSRTGLPGIYVWSHAIDFGRRRFALTQVRATEDPSVSPLAESLGYEPTRFAIGIIDADGFVTSVSSDVGEIIGVQAGELMGRHLLPRDQRDLWARFHTKPLSHDGCSMSFPYRPPETELAPNSVQCLLICLAGSDSYCFILAPHPPRRLESARSRVAELEQYLLRIAQEVESSGVIGGLTKIPDPDRFPQLKSLNARQWDVLTRLLRGDRVPAIATKMYLSQSAVRNYLSDIFRRFDVHSQSELLAVLRSSDDSSERRT
jgi:DNA-binding CsgD family transcriptional regulator/PAS domain-containing protein